MNKVKQNTITYAYLFQFLMMKIAEGQYIYISVFYKTFLERIAALRNIQSRVCVLLLQTLGVAL